MNKKAKYIMIDLLKILVVIVFIYTVEVVCSIAIGRPIFAIKEDNVYKGLFFDVYNCSEYAVPQIVPKNRMFACSEVKVKDYKNYMLVADVSNSCDKTLYLDGDRKIYLYCIDKIFVMDQYSVLTDLNTFINKDIEKLDLFLENRYEGEMYDDGGSISYEVEFGDTKLRVDRCNSLNGNKNIYIGTEDMKFMCS